MVRILPLAALVCLATGCGDDLESRNAAIEEARAAGAAAPDAATAPLPDPVPTASPASAPEDDEAVVVDAQPTELIDDAQGFSTDPIDDASGYDPNPQAQETGAE